MKNEPAKTKHEFHVSIGIELPPETAKRIAKAIQRSVLDELAGLDLGGPLSVDFLGGGRRASAGENGGTQGIAIIAERR
jgi:hypothetical protein